MGKSFKDKMQQKAVNPTLQFISTPEPEKEPQPIEKKKPEASSSTRKTSLPTRKTTRAVSTFDDEIRNRRLQLLLTPSLYQAVKDNADRERISVNELINMILMDAMRK